MRITSLLVSFLLIFSNIAFAESGWQGDKAIDISTDYLEFTDLLLASDGNLQHDLEIIDQIDVSPSGAYDSEYLMLDATNDPITGDLRLNTGVKLELDDGGLSYFVKEGNSVKLYVNSNLRQTWTTVGTLENVIYLGENVLFAGEQVVF